MSFAELKLAEMEEKILQLEQLTKSLSSDVITSDKSRPTESKTESGNELNSKLAVLEAQRDQAIHENMNLKKDIAKLNYRVSHLVKALNEEEKAKQYISNNFV
mmetsp:Transcript_17063/g.17129  ORF Transcript_17063/g.17129 Transcript_17063/m.17129 type:complete len:103 (-) Transcript_17063:334-642(-)